MTALETTGVQARAITILWWVFFGLLSAIFLTVLAIALGSLRRNRRRVTDLQLGKIVGIAVGVTVVIIFGLIIVSVSTGKTISHPEHSLTIEVQGQQWWWYVRYLNDDPSRIVVTANEIHIPTKTNVELRLTSLDVIHSFWVPELNGKRDLIPSRINTQWIEADRPGRYRGQCAEFCGLQHAKMGLWVVADSPDVFERWYQNQLAPAVSPQNLDAQRGQQVFLNKTCVFCHSIQGTTAAGQVAPDLTHFASRSTIAAGALPNTMGNLAGWISDPQSIKPGNHMATVPITAEEMQPLLVYLESLK